MASNATAAATAPSKYAGAFTTSSKTRGIKTTAVAMRLIIGRGLNFAYEPVVKAMEQHANDTLLISCHHYFLSS
jgi:hypothetical protein